MKKDSVGEREKKTKSLSFRERKEVHNLAFIIFVGREREREGFPSPTWPHPFCGHWVRSIQSWPPLPPPSFMDAMHLPFSFIFTKTDCEQNKISLKFNLKKKKQYLNSFPPIIHFMNWQHLWDFMYFIYMWGSLIFFFFFWSKWIQKWLAHENAL